MGSHFLVFSSIFSKWESIERIVREGIYSDLKM